MVNNVTAPPVNENWNALWTSQFGHWITAKGLHIVLVLASAWIATRVIRWIANKIS
ncbi:MAG: moderate conductance mechanosensitive channel, partial [Mycobacterium sp.]|nr:moderate conductance mechanosensitive channel [Mycobacterium sp.]